MSLCQCKVCFQKHVCAGSSHGLGPDEWKLGKGQFAKPTGQLTAVVYNDYSADRVISIHAVGKYAVILVPVIRHGGQKKCSG